MCFILSVRRFEFVRQNICIAAFKKYYYTSDSLWKIWLVESIQSIHNSLWTWHDKCNICCRYCIYHVKFNVCLVTKPLGVFSSETKWLTQPSASADNTDLGFDNSWYCSTSSNNCLRWFPSKRSHHRSPMKLGMLMLQDKEILKT